MVSGTHIALTNNAPPLSLQSEQLEDLSTAALALQSHLEVVSNAGSSETRLLAHQGEGRSGRFRTPLVHLFV
eukprot:2840287-Rhodomonas_salina.1